ncbi:O-antigen ligase family protein [Aeromonas enteropelogenes]|uniref:O-antigen ligase family protein n=1 Tax=Aeromonas enteropelogenes TaxID=29489 RepID=UPI002286057D|nr:O-antigen ligase family protein [Aeromonas enteropelogenes]MCZ0753828.1 O-antigen ligase family protein [Aeromonas enteropelogenes]
MVIKYSGALIKITKLIYFFTIVFSFSGLFFFENGKTLLSNFFVISIIMGGVSYAVGYRDVGLNDRRLLWLFIAYAAMIFLNRMIHGDQYGVMRALIYVALFGLLMPRSDEMVKAFRIGTILGGVGLGFIAIWQEFNGVMRIEGFTHPILFAQACLSLFVINFFFFIKYKERLVVKLSLLFSMILSLWALYLSQSRGVWVAIIILVGLYLAVKALKKPKKYTLIILLMMAGAAITIPNSNIIKSRINDSVGDITYAQSGYYGTSWGLRMVAWKSAWLGFMDHPILGIGTNNFDELKKQQVEKGLVSPLVLDPALVHAHNQYMQSLLIRGLVGTMMLMVFLLYPFFLSSENRFISPISFICLAFAIYGLSDVPFEHQNVLYIYAMSLLMILFSNEIEKGRVS